MDGVKLRFNLVALEQRHAAITIRLHLLGVARHQHAHKRFRRFVAAFTFDHDFINIAAVKITNRPFNQACFFVHQSRRLRDQRILADLVP